ncbi:hypothetical protein [Mariniblastus fucicola]|uniref:hypothetical protein n=1 Tax=Mariniblastus fucicola TaxID=980251 RepID=UPI0011DFE76D|nr:hypothetical protein [Mariniblastus fucicola]
MNRMQLKSILVALAITAVTLSGVVAQSDPQDDQQTTVQQAKSPQEDSGSTSDTDSDFAAQIDKFTKRKIGQQKYSLNYKLKKGDVIRWQHDHRTVVETRFGTASDKTSTRARPEFKWTVQNVDSRGTIRFDIEMEKIKVLEQKGESDPINYDSEKDKEAPGTCLPYQERLGRVCSTYSISPNGQVVNKKSNYDYQIKLGGVGDNPVIAFPNEPIPVGHKWDVTDTVKARDEYGSNQQLKLRVRYVLEKVVDGKAHVTFTTNVMTPHIDETTRSQVVTHMARGFIVFDIAKGLITNRETRWDERVIGYQGPESYMHYTAFRKELLVQEEKVAVAAPVAKVAKKNPVPGEEQRTRTLLQPLKK